AGSRGPPGTMFTSMQESMFQGPILGEVVPAVVFHFPTGMAQATNQGSGEGGGRQGADPKPFMGGGLRLRPAPPVMSLGHLLLGADHPHGLRMILGKRQSLLLPETHLVGLALLVFA